MHAHKCKGCGTKFYHSDEMRSNVEAHKCPLCGKAEWEQFAPENAKLPNFTQTIEAVKAGPLSSFAMNAIDIALIVTAACMITIMGIQVYRMVKGGASA